MKALISEQYLIDIVAAIHSKNGESTCYTPEEMAQKIREITCNDCETDYTPYKYRKSPYTDLLSESIVGVSCAWNQMMDKSGYPASKTESGITFTNNGDGSITVNGTATATVVYEMQTIATNTLLAGHKYLILTGCASVGSNSTFEFMIIRFNGSVSYNGYKDAIVSNTGGNNFNTSLARLVVRSGATVNLKFTPQIIDLTQMFGSTVADALYNMGDSGIALFRSWYPKPYYAFSNPTLEHVSGLESHDMVGFNTFDIGASVLGESINANTGAIRVSETAWRSDYIRCLAETDYYASGLTNAMNSMIAFYDSDKNFLGRTSGAAAAYRSFTTPQGCAYYIITQYTSGTQTFTDGRDTVCVNIFDESMNGTYKPYSKHSYALDASLILRGLLKYDSTKGFYADGDVYASDGTVTRKYRELVITGDTITSVSTASTGVQAAVFMLGSAYRGANNANLVASNGFRPVTSAPSEDKAVRVTATAGYIYDNTFTDLATAKTLLNTSPITLVYELATPTTEEADPYEAIQITDGTEEYVTDCLAPVGHDSTYHEDPCTPDLYGRGSFIHEVINEGHLPS